MLTFCNQLSNVRLLSSDSSEYEMTVFLGVMLCSLVDMSSYKPSEDESE